MGKPDGELPISHSSPSAGDPRRNADLRCGCTSSAFRKFIGLRCIFILLFSFAVFLSALFWLPPFSRLSDLNSDAQFKDHDIVASFVVGKPVSLLQDNILQLEQDIFEEIGVPFTEVVVLSLDPFYGTNMTKVVFAVDPDGDGEYSEMSIAAVSLIRSLYESLVIRQSFLHFGSNLFGDAFFFEVLKFQGGLTVIPPQSGFPMQAGQILFNFTLNFSIYQIQSSFEALTSQLKSGLHLAPYENLYVRLSNSEGSTVAAPTIVQSSVFMAIGIPPSKERLKQLAQTITGSHFKNLGLNNTEFGRVKQVRLSSILQHSLHGGSGTTWSPSPAPLPHPHYPHRHNHHPHHHSAHQAPVFSPTPAPAARKGALSPVVGSPAAPESAPAPRSSQVKSPNCRSARNFGKHAHQPSVAPSITPAYPVASPKQQVGSPPHVSHSVPAFSPLPNVAFAHAEPPPTNGPGSERSDSHFHGPSPSSSLAGCRRACEWTSLILLALVLCIIKDFNV